MAGQRGLNIQQVNFLRNDLVGSDQGKCFFQFQISNFRFQIDKKLMRSNQNKYLSFWGNSEKKTFFLSLQWLFSGRNRPHKEFC